MNLNYFSLEGRNIIVTGSCGLLGREHCSAIVENGGNLILIDLDSKSLEKQFNEINLKFPGHVKSFHSIDISNEEMVKNCAFELQSKNIVIDGLVNNAALNPHFDKEAINSKNLLEDFNLDQWNREINVGLTGSFLCCKYFGAIIAKNPHGGSIVNISSDLGIIAPNHNIYHSEEKSFFKPVTYSVIKHGMIGLTKYISTYWNNAGVRCNSLCPGGVFNDQDEEFVSKVSSLIPLGRMAEKSELRGGLVFLLSEASSYMTGTNLIIDGGRTSW
jgi:NAD(P)-dependent dehydrogenase (short-subunit alcohol dehydrogenase family)